MSTNDKLAAFQVPWSMHVLSGFVSRFPGLSIALGNLESLTLREQIEKTPIDRPIYVAGLARAGTTILLELLSRYPDVATHQYRDFPGQFIPTWWNRGDRPASTAPRERAHGDGLAVTENSPEAMEETLWMAFFRGLHNCQRNNVLDSRTTNVAFEKFYSDHIRKVLITRNRSRYVAKGNYNFTRFAYIQKIFPTARFIAVIRNPRTHIASLIKEQRLFCAGELAYPRALAHMQRVGHFEFGLDRRPINVGDGIAQEVQELWEEGEEVRGTARYWASLYRWFADQLQENEKLDSAVQLVRFEDLCAEPQSTAKQLLAHCELKSSSEVANFAERIREPRYYTPDFTEAEEQAIAEETDEVAERFGYEPSLSRLQAFAI